MRSAPAKDDIGDPGQHAVRLQRRRHDRAVHRRWRRRGLRQELGARRSSTTARSSPTRRSSASATTSTRSSASTSMAATTARPARTSAIAAAAPTATTTSALMASLQVKFGAPAVAPPPPPPPPARRVLHGVLRLGPLEPVAAGAEHDRAGGRRLQDQGQCPHHGDRPHRHVGPGELQHGAVAAPCQRGQGRAGADGVPATAISVVGKGESQPLVPTADGVREPQNRRVEIVIQ